MADIEQLIERLEFLRCQPNSKRSNDAVDDALETAASALSAQQREIAELREALTCFVNRERTIKIEIGSVHRARGAAASEWMREDDRDFRRELEAAFDKARAALNTPSQEGERR